MGIRVVLLIVTGHGVDDALWFLRGRGVVEVYEFLTVRQSAPQDREIAPYSLDIQSHCCSSVISNRRSNINSRPNIPVIMAGLLFTFSHRRRKNPEND